MYEGAIQDLIDALGMMPGIGPKGAQRIAFWLLEQDGEVIDHLVEVFQTTKDKVVYCEVCFNFSESSVCRICANPSRDQHCICVVEEPNDVAAIERTREFRGLYHVLGGRIDPQAGIGPDQLRLRELVRRLGNSQVSEVILATNPTVTGDATSLYIQRLLGSIEGLQLTKLASGLPVGSDLEYADTVTLGRAFNGRQYLG
jgi:recombination protein RecR